MHLLTYFDLTTVERELYHAIHGGPQPNAGRLASWLSARRIRMPCQLMALYVGCKPTAFGAWQKSADKRGGALVLRLHPSMAYLIFNGASRLLASPLRRRRIVASDPKPIRKPSEIVSAAQDAIVALRSRQLAPLVRRLGPVDFGDEVRARREASQAARKNGRDWRAKLKRWCEIVLVRHLGQLNTIRRKFVEFLALLTHDLFEGWGLEYPFACAVQELYATFAITELPGVFIKHAAPLISIIARRQPDGLDAGAAVSESVQHALAFLARNFAHPIGLAEAAQAVHTSAPHLSRLFRRETGRTLTRHLQGLRVADAQKHLVESSDGILEIALASGFPTLEHFYRTFKKRTGLTPRAFRQAQRA